MEHDRAILLEALDRAVRIHREKIPRPTLMSPPDTDALEVIAAAIRECRTFQAVSGHVLYSGGAGPILDAPLLAFYLFQRADHGNDLNDAVSWSLRVLTTRKTLGLFKAAVWGLSINEEAQLSASSRMMPFEAMPVSFMKTRVAERAKPCYDGSSWISNTYFDLPRTAFIRDIPEFPYIGTDGACFNKIAQLQQETRDLWIVIGSICVGQPLAIGCWFEYAHQDLDFVGWQNAISWILPEIHPRIASSIPKSSAAIEDDLQRYAALPASLRSDLLRSMDRYTLSQCRHQMIDRVLDLTLAFEIAVSGDADQAPPGWKVSVCSAQLIGGALEVRKKNRQTISELYRLRNRATHGSRLQGRDVSRQQSIVRECSDLYRELLQSFLASNAEPDWSALELEPRSN